MRTGKHSEEILLIHPGALGDLVQAFPAFGAIRRTFDEARITLLVGDSFAAVARQTKLFDEILTFSASTAYHGSAIARLRLFAVLAATVTARAPTRAGVFKGAPVYALLALASGARTRVGLSRGLGKRLLTNAISINPDLHREDRYLAVARALGADTHPVAEACWDASRRFDSLRTRLGGGPLIGMVPGGARNAKEELPVKRWAPHRYAELGARLLQLSPRARVVLLGGPGDREEAEIVKRALPRDSVLDLVGSTSVAEAREAIAQLTVFVGHDTGLLHIAATTPTPVVAIFGPTDPRAICPRRPNVHVLWKPAFSSPCYDEITGQMRTCAPECCIDRSDVESVVSIVRGLLL